MIPIALIAWMNRDRRHISERLAHAGRHEEGLPVAHCAMRWVEVRLQLAEPAALQIQDH